MSETSLEHPSTSVNKSSPTMTWLTGLFPLVLLGVLVWLLLATSPLKTLGEFPPIEELTVERVTLESDPHQIIIQVINGGPDPVTIAQVLVDEAYWMHSIEPSRTLNRLDQAKIVVPYPWVEGEAHELMLITASGVTFNHAIEVAVETPKPDIRFFGIFALIGIYVGVLPVAIGMLWTPFLRRLGRKWTQSFLALTIGLLLFLGVDTVKESLNVAGRVPEAIQGIAIVAIGAVLSFLALEGVTRWLTLRTGGNDATVRLAVAFSIAIGIGIHNIGRGTRDRRRLCRWRNRTKHFPHRGFHPPQRNRGAWHRRPDCPHPAPAAHAGLARVNSRRTHDCWRLDRRVYLLRRLGNVLPRDRCRGHIPSRLRGGQTHDRQCQKERPDYRKLCRDRCRHDDHVCNRTDSLAGRRPMPRKGRHCIDGHPMDG